MGTGVGEAMLLQSLATGAAVGAGTSALTGSDPLKGALFGALGGAVMPGIGSALGGAPAGTVGAAAPGAVASAVPGAATQTAFQAALPELGVSTMASAAPSSIVPGSFQSAIADQGIKTAASSAIPSAAPAITPQTGFTDIFKSTAGGPGFGERVGNFIVQNPGQAAMTGAGAANMFFNRPESNIPGQPEYEGPLKRFRYSPDFYRPGYAEGGIAEALPRGNMFPQSQLPRSEYATPTQMPTSEEVVMASGGIADLGGYSDGGRLLKGPGDGMSDSIPASIGRKQPARLADGEFVVPADVVSHLGNGSTDAGAKQLYTMMDKVRRARTGNKKQGKEINPRKYLPA